MVKLQKPFFTSISYTPRSLSLHDYETLKVLCETIIPAGRESGGAIEARVPESINLMARQDMDYQRQLVDGINLARCGLLRTLRRACSPGQQKIILDLIAFGKNAHQDPLLLPGIKFFATLRKDTELGRAHV